MSVSLGDEKSKARYLGLSFMLENNPSTSRATKDVELERSNLGMQLTSNRVQTCLPMSAHACSSVPCTSRRSGRSQLMPDTLGVRTACLESRSAQRCAR